MEAPSVAEELTARAEQLSTQIAADKAAIRQRRYRTAGERRRLRARLGSAKARLTELEAECRRIGVRLVIVNKPTPGEGDRSSWPPAAHPS